MRPWPLLLGAAALTGAPSASPEIESRADIRASLAADPPIIREARYRMSAAVRPLLIFWIRAGNVGAARILWRGDGNGRRGYELLIGSDPRRAPRKINRWGWEREDAGPEGATLLGVMRKTDEESLDEAKTELGREGKQGYIFKAIRSQVTAEEVRAENTLWRVPRDYTYRDLDELLALVASPSSEPPRVRRTRVQQDVHPGFLFAVTALVDEAVAAASAPEPDRRLLANRSATFTFNASLYDLTLRSSRWLASATYGGRRYERLVRLQFEHFNREKKTRERFVLVCGTDGSLARVPVFVEYQPKWWFKAEGVLDDSEVFP